MSGAKRFWKLWRWVNPYWLKRSYIGYLIALGGAVFLTVPLLLILPTLREGELAPVIGDTPYKSPFEVEAILGTMLIILFGFLVFFVELLATFDATRTSARSIDQRPVNSFHLWWRTQVDGTQRFPLQLAMASPIAVLCIIFGTSIPIDVAITKTIQIFVALAMFRTLYVTALVAQSLQSCFRKFFWVWLTASHLILSGVLILGILAWLYTPSESWIPTMLLFTGVAALFAVIVMLKDRLNGNRTVGSPHQSAALTNSTS